jgi:hypothetical protein
VWAGGYDVPDVAADGEQEAQFVVHSQAPGDNRPQQGSMDAVILPVSCCDTNASVRVGI